LKNYYEMLSLPRNAPADEIKKAFRREIARYHPDKVQHLGPEFQDMASGIAADLTEAYRILMDPGTRAKYDQELGAGAPSAPPPPVARPPAPEAGPPPPPRPDPAPEPHHVPPQRPTAGFDFVRRAALSKIREAIADVLGTAETFPAPRFDIAIVTRPKKGLFKKSEESICLLIKVVPFVDAAAIAEVWLPASKTAAPGASGCAVLLVGQGLAEARELAAAVNEQRRKTRGAGPLIVPVDVRDWEALFPPETPGAVRSLIQRLKDEKR
jgi:curved DNA-binding protein CbpA